MSDQGVSPSGPGSPLQPQAASAAIPDAEDTVQRLMGLAMDFAHAYSFVGDDTMPRRKAALESALRKDLIGRKDRSMNMGELHQQLEISIFDWLCRKYVQRADARQKSLGLQYTEAETHDLAEEIAKNVAQWADVHLREGSLPDRANPARDESPKAIEPDPKGRAQ